MKVIGERATKIKIGSEEKGFNYIELKANKVYQLPVKLSKEKLKEYGLKEITEGKAETKEVETKQFEGKKKKNDKSRNKSKLGKF